MEEKNFEPMEDEDLLREILLPILDHPEELVIGVRKEGNEKTLLICCSAGDRGRIIGKRGCNMSAIRQIFRSIAYHEKRVMYVEVEDPSKDRRFRQQRVA